jgi:hypothetical protein
MTSTNRVLAALPLWQDGVYDTMEIANNTRPVNPGRDPRFRKIVESILFSRRFVPTYNLVLLGVLVGFAVCHWAEKITLRRKRRSKKVVDKVDEGAGGAWSSSSSTGDKTLTMTDALQMKRDDLDERTPLLATGRRRREASRSRKPYHRFWSWMQYQPRPIPIINKALPTNMVTLCVVAYIGLNGFYSFYAMPLSLFYIPAFADRCGLLFMANLPLLYLLAAKNQPIKMLTGYSYESLNIFHRRVGELMCFQALLHAVGMMFVWWGLLRHLGLSLAGFLLNHTVLLGIGAFAAYEVLYFTSLGSFRQKMYEIFLATHIILQITGLAFLWFHYSKSRPYVGVSLAIFLIDRLVFRLWLKSSSHSATLTILDDDETLVVSANWDLTAKKTALIPHSMARGWKPNDHIFLTIPSLSRKHALQAHPLTIFSAAPTTGIDEQGTHAWFSVLIRAQSESGFTRALLEHARSHVKTHIRLDGPYGSSHALDILSTADTAILVAGGSGIAVAYPLLYALLSPPSTDVDAERALPSSPTRNVKLLWITHSAEHGSWIPADKMQELQDWGLEVVMPPPTAEAGRPDVGTVVEGWTGEGNTAVVVSGPDGLVRGVRNTVAGLMGEGVDVRLQVEKFGW